MNSKLSLCLQYFSLWYDHHHHNYNYNYSYSYIIKCAERKL